MNSNIIIIMDYILKPANNYYGEIFEIDNLNDIYLYVDQLIIFSGKKYFVRTEENESVNKRNSRVILRKKILCELK